MMVVAVVYSVVVVVDITAICSDGRRSATEHANNSIIGMDIIVVLIMTACRHVIIGRHGKWLRCFISLASISLSREYYYAKEKHRQNNIRWWVLSPFVWEEVGRLF